MKILKWVGWASASIGAVLIVLGTISQLIKSIHFGVQHNFSIFIAASSFLMLALVLFIGSKNCCQDSCCKEEKSKE